MATGHDNQLTRQIGEHLVAAELGRRGYVATPFAGNVPMYDLKVAKNQKTYSHCTAQFGQKSLKIFAITGV